jgi:hypothetical protein
MENNNKKHFNFFGLNVTFKKEEDSADICLESLARELELKIEQTKSKNNTLGNEEVLSLVLLKEAYDNKVLVNKYKSNFNQLNKNAKEAFEVLSSLQKSNVLTSTEEKALN